MIIGRDEYHDSTVAVGVIVVVIVVIVVVVVVVVVVEGTLWTSNTRPEF